MSLRNHPASQAIKNILAPRPASASLLDSAGVAAAQAADAKAKLEAEAAEKAKEQAALDSANATAIAEAEAKAKADAEAAALDAAAAASADAETVLDAASGYQDTDVALKAVAAVQEWAETTPSDLDDKEGLGDRLFSLLAGIADSDMDGEISDAEADVINAAANAAADYMISKGVPESDAVSLLTDYDNELADSVQELVLTSLPDGDEEAAADIDSFVFGDGSDESALDSVLIGADGVIVSGAIFSHNGVILDAAMFAGLAQQPDWLSLTAEQVREFAIKGGADPAVLDATYKKKTVVRRGRKVRINKRVSGTVRLNAKQKIAVRKMLRKSHSAVAQVRRAKSMRVRARSGL